MVHLEIFQWGKESLSPGTNETFLFTSRISFTDSDEPNPDSPDDKWYTMRSFNDYRITYSEISPHSIIKTVFNITASGIHKTDWCAGDGPIHSRHWDNAGGNNTGSLRGIVQRGKICPSGVAQNA